MGTTIQFIVIKFGLFPILIAILADLVVIKCSLPSAKHIVIFLFNVLILIPNFFIISGEMQLPCAPESVRI